MAFPFCFSGGVGITVDDDVDRVIAVLLWQFL